MLLDSFIKYSEVFLLSLRLVFSVIVGMDFIKSKDSLPPSRSYVLAQKLLLQYVLGVMFVMFLVRFVYLIDPFQAYNYLGPVMANVAPTLSIAISLVGNLLMTFYWHQLISHMAEHAGGRVLTLIPKMKIPFIIISTLLLFLILLWAIFQSTNTYFLPVQIAGYAVLTIVAACVAIFFLVTGKNWNTV